MNISWKGESSVNSFIKKIILAPMLLLCPAMGVLGSGSDTNSHDTDEHTSAENEPELDLEALGHIIDSRIARAERGVLRDYFAQHGIEGDAAVRAEERYRQFRNQSRPDKDTVRELERKCGQAEKLAKELAINSAAKIQLARMGVEDEYAEDVLTLARRQLEREGIKLSSYNTEDASRCICEAVEKVLTRLPQLSGGGQAAAYNKGFDSGSTGNFPRKGGSQNILQQQLESLRASGDTVSAVALINSAAEKGISLR